MQPNPGAVCRSLAVMLLLSLAPFGAWAGPRPLPDAVVHARSIFLENETGFHELGYSTVLELSKWGRFELAESRERADLILRLNNGNRVRCTGPMGARSKMATFSMACAKPSTATTKASAKAFFAVACLKNLDQGAPRRNDCGSIGG